MLKCSQCSLIEMGRHSAVEFMPQCQQPDFLRATVHSISVGHMCLKEKERTPPPFFPHLTVWACGSKSKP